VFRIFNTPEAILVFVLKIINFNMNYKMTVANNIFMPEISMDENKSFNFEISLTTTTGS
jgi:hypothetical protein